MRRVLVSLFASLLAWPIAGAMAFAQPENPELQLDDPEALEPGGSQDPSIGEWLEEDYNAEAAGDEEEFDDDQAAEDEAWLRGELAGEPADEAVDEYGDEADAIAQPGLEAEAETAEVEHEEGEQGDAPGAEHGEHHEEYTGAGPIPNFFAGIVNFLIWLAIVVFLGRKPLSEFLQSRRHNIKDGLDEAARLTKAAEAKYAECSDRLEHLDEEVERLKAEMIAAGRAESDRIMADAEAKAARLRRDTQFVIEQRVKQLRSDLTREAVEAAIRAAEVALTEQVSEADQQKLAEGFLSQIRTKVDDEVQA